MPHKVNPSMSPDDSAITRRALLRQAGWGALGAAALPLGATAATAPTNSDAKAPAPKSGAPGAGNLPPLNRFPRMVHDWFLARVSQQERATEAQRAALRTKAQAAAFIQERAAKVKQCFGPLPPKTPLNARVTGRVERDAYSIENVIFESRPGFLV